MMVEQVSSVGKHFNIDIKNPCAKNGEDQFLRVENQYGGHGQNTFQFVNWRMK